MNEVVKNDITKKGMSVKDWIITTFCVIYVIFPLDLIPDAIPFVGWVDDLLAGLTGIATVLNSKLSRTNIIISGLLKLVKVISISLFFILAMLITLVGLIGYQIFS